MNEASVKHMIAMKQVRKTYRNGPAVLPVLKGADLYVNEGEFCAVTGASGSGKSTLLHIIGALDTADAGDVICDGRNISAMSESDLPEFRRTAVGFIFQNHYLIDDLHALDNVMIPNLMCGYSRKKTAEKAESILEAVGLQDRLAHYPNQLSGGEKQRVAIARAFMNNPKIILADEPTGNLDEKNTENILALLLDLVSSEQKTIILVTHDLEAAEVGDTLYHLNEGVLQKQ